jgi:hypothetical protein
VRLGPQPAAGVQPQGALVPGGVEGGERARVRVLVRGRELFGEGGAQGVARRRRVRAGQGGERDGRRDQGRGCAEKADPDRIRARVRRQVERRLGQPRSPAIRVCSERICREVRPFMSR